MPKERALRKNRGVSGNPSSKNRSLNKCTAAENSQHRGKCQSTFLIPSNLQSATSRSKNGALQMVFAELPNTVDAVFAGNRTGAGTPPTNRLPYACGSAMVPKVLRATEVISTTTGVSSLLAALDLKERERHAQSKSRRSIFATPSTRN